MGRPVKRNKARIGLGAAFVLAAAAMLSALRVCAAAANVDLEPGKYAVTITSEVQDQRQNESRTTTRCKLLIDDPTTHIGDGYAVDFVRILVNPHKFKYEVSLTATVTDADTHKPITGATVTAGLSTTSTDRQRKCEFQGNSCGLRLRNYQCTRIRRKFCSSGFAGGEKRKRRHSTPSAPGKHRGARAIRRANRHCHDRRALSRTIRRRTADS